MNKKRIRQIKCLFTLLFVITASFSITRSYAQSTNVTIDLEQVPIERVMNEIEKQTNYLFLSNKDVDIHRIVTIRATDRPLAEVLDQMVSGTDISYSVDNQYITLSIQMPETMLVKGFVSDKSGPVIGATVMIKNSTVGTTTSADGSFSLEAKKGDVLLVSFIGYKALEIPYAGQTELRITLEEESTMVNTVVVTALGIKREEKSLSYNVQQVKAEELTTVKDANFMNSLVGKVAGVTINAGANGPGGASRVVMRGAKSLTGSNQALYVIDGIPMFNFSTSPMFNSQTEASSMSEQPGTDGVADINPDDIESISMLTGPSAAALYGNAAASGVVLITTKKGQADRTVVTLSNSTTFSRVYMMPRMQSKYGNAVGQIASWGSRVDSDYDPRNYFNTGANVINTVSLSTGNQKNQIYASASTTNSTGTLPNSEYDRYNFSARYTSKFAKDKLSFDLGTNYVKQTDLNMMSQGIYYNPLPGLYLFPRSDNFEDIRLYERYDAALGYNTVYWPYGNNNVGMQNPYWVQNRELRENKKDRYMLSGSLKWEVTDWFDIAGRVKVDNYHNVNTYKLYASTDNLWAGANGSYRNVTSDLKSTYADVIATVKKSWNDWSLNVNVGASLNDSKYESVGYNGQLAEIPNFFTVKNLDRDTKYKPTQDGYHDQAQALFANIEVGWKSMLYLTLTGRNDWESRLAYSNYTSFFYPSVGLSAVVSNMFNAPKWLSFLKVRGSYTEVGNSYDRYMTKVYYKYDGESGSWSSSSTYPNLDLKPERTKSWEVGVNARFLNHINFDLTYYRSNTYNQTFYAKLPPASGYVDTPVQSGNILNQGIEMALGYNNEWGDFSFSTNYTLTWNENKIISLVDGVRNPLTGELIEMGDEIEKGGFGGLDAKLILREGGSMGDVFAYHLLKRDFNGYIYDDPSAGLSVEEKKTFLGSIFPKANMGWNTHFGWKGLDLGMTFSARLGGIVMSATESYLDQYGVSERSAKLRDAGGVKINEGMVDAQKYLSVISGNAAYYTYDATNIRLQELSLNYTLPKKWFRDKVRMTIGFVGKNLWMIYCKAPFDPELSAEVMSNYYQGFDSFMLPSTRNFGFNVKLQF